MMSALRMGALCGLHYLALVVNYRMVAQGRILETVVSDGVLALLGFTVVKAIAGAESRGDRIGYAIGGMLGSALGIVLTKALYGA